MKNFFNSKSIRERVLMTALLLVAVALWGTSLLGRTRLLQVEWTMTADEITRQQNLFTNKARVAERTAKITAQLNPSLTLNSAQAYAEINRLAQGLSPDMGAQRSEPTENFAMHSFQLTFHKIELRALRDFYLELSKKFPYLGIDQCAISIDRSAPTQVNAVFRIYSVQVLHPAKP